MAAKLKPCPLCGKPGKNWNTLPHIACCSNPSCILESFFGKTKEWNRLPRRDHLQKQKKQKDALTIQLAALQSKLSAVQAGASLLEGECAAVLKDLTRVELGTFHSGSQMTSQEQCLITRTTRQRLADALVAFRSHRAALQAGTGVAFNVAKFAKLDTTIPAPLAKREECQNGEGTA